jgi:hypothetical protein
MVQQDRQVQQDLQELTVQLDRQVQLDLQVLLIQSLITSTVALQHKQAMLFTTQKLQQQSLGLTQLMLVHQLQHSNQSRK